MVLCPNCNGKLEVIYETIYDCTLREFMMKIGDFERLYGNVTNAPWYKRVTDDHTLWVSQAFTDCPSIIAHEYARLYEILKDGQTYGALLQMKDVFEVILKFPVLLIVSDISHKQEKTDDEIGLIHSCLKKPLNLREWRDFANLILNEKLTKDHALVGILKDLKKHYFNQTLDIVKWRNDTIGHGALQFDDDEKFQGQFIARLHMIKQHFEKCLPLYRNVSFFTLIEKKEHVLKGRYNASNLPAKAHFLYTKLEHRNIPSYPFILIDQEEIYFFDTYINKKMKVSVLNYPKGYKKDYFHHEHMTDFFQTQYEKCVDYLVASGKRKELIQLEDSAEMDSFLTSNEKMANELELTDDVFPQEHLSSWLMKLIENEKKGVFLLQMERGMGKSTFVRTFDENSLHTVLMDHVSVRAYYANDTYLANSDYFISYLSDIFRLDANGQLVFREKMISIINRDSEEKQQELINFLSHYHQLYQERYHKKKLLFVIDGIDELPSGAKSVLDFIPKPEQLPEDMYILLTCRLDGELSPLLKDFLQRLNLSKRFSKSVQKKDPNNIQSILNYLAGKEKEGKVRNLLEISDYRFLYANMIKNLLKYDSSFSINAMHQPNLYTNYLEKMKNCYGEKHFGEIERMLVILAIQKEPLSIKELTFLLGHEYITFKHLAYLSDIKPLIKKERSYRGNLLSLHNNELREYLLEHYRGKISEIIYQWTRIVKYELESSKGVQVQEIHDGLSYLLASLPDYIAEFEVDPESFQLETYVEQLMDAAEGMRGKGAYVHINRRYFMIYQLIVGHMSFAADDRDVLYQAQAYSRLGDQFFTKSIYSQEETIGFYQRAISLRKSFLEKIKETSEYLNKGDKNDRLSAFLEIQHKNVQENFIDIGRVYYRVGNYPMALQYLEPAVEQLELHCDIAKEEDVFQLSNALLELARTLSKLERNKESLPIAKRVLSLQEKFSKSNVVFYSMQARTIETIGFNYFRMGDYTTARSLFFDSYQILKDSNTNVEVEQKSIFEAKLLESIGNTFLESKQFPKAAPYYENALDLFHQFTLHGIDFEPILTMESHLYLGQCYLDFGKYDDGIVHLKAALELVNQYEDLYDKGHLAYFTVANQIFMGLADCYYLKHDYPKANDQYQGWIDLQKTVLESLEVTTIPLQDLQITLERMCEIFQHLQYPIKEREYQVYYERIQGYSRASYTELQLSSFKDIFGIKEIEIEKQANSFTEYIFRDANIENPFSCKNNRQPLYVRENEKKKYVSLEFHSSDCEACAYLHCPAKNKKGKIRISYKALGF